MLEYAWIIPAIPVRVVRPDPVLRQEDAEGRFGDRHPRRRLVVRAVVHHRGPVVPAGRGRVRRARWRGASRRSGRASSPVPRAATRSCDAGGLDRPVVPDQRRHRHGRYPHRRSRGDDALRRHPHLAARAHLLDRVHARRPSLHLLLRRAVALHRVDAHAGRRVEHARSCSSAGSWSVSAPSCSSGTGGRSRRTPTPR